MSFHVQKWPDSSNGWSDIPSKKEANNIFNHSKGLFFNRALDKFSECQYNMSFHVQKWPDSSNGWSDIPSKKEANKKEGKKRWGEK